MVKATGRSNPLKFSHVVVDLGRGKQTRDAFDIGRLHLFFLGVGPEAVNLPADINRCFVQRVAEVGPRSRHTLPAFLPGP